MIKRVIKKTIVVLGVVVVVVSGNPCDTNERGDWCFQDGYVTCPSHTVRPCQAGLVCQQQSPGVVYCVRPEELSLFLASLSITPSSSSSDVPTFAASPSAPIASSSSSSSLSSSSSSSSVAKVPSSKIVAQPRIAPALPVAPLTGSMKSWPNGPIKAIYIDNHCWDPSFTFNTLVDAGYNLIVLAFFINNGPFDCAIAWEQLNESGQKKAIQYAHSHGCKIIVSAGGATESPYATTPGARYGEIVAQWARRNHLDGVDFDLENFGRDFTFGNMNTSATVQWVVDATNAARAVLGPHGLITHAPQPPYFGNNGWADGYGKIYKLAPTIDYFLVQYYNNGPTNTYETIFLHNLQGASVTEIASQGIPLSKIVVGKPVHLNDIEHRDQGFNTGQELQSIFARAKAEIGWSAGVMGWQWVSAESNGQWINSIFPTSSASSFTSSSISFPASAPASTSVARAPSSLLTNANTAPRHIAPPIHNWPKGPIKAIYIDNHCWDPSFTFNTLVDAGYNLIVLAFFINNGPFDCAIAWEQLTESGQIKAIEYAHSHGCKIIVSAGGATESPYATTPGARYGEIVAQWAQRNHLDGVDFDLENFGRDFTFGNMNTSATVQWVVDATNAARAVLGPHKLITHAPQPPYFGNNGWADGYGKIYNLAPTIDYFLIQYYNNGPTNTYETIFLHNLQGASVTEIAAQGIPLSKIIVGKPVHLNDIEHRDQGFNTGQELQSIFARAKAEIGWSAGVMGWQWVSAESNGQWINSIFPNHH